VEYDQYRALAQLANSQWWNKAVKPMLEARLKDLDALNRTGEGATGHRNQGRALELAEIISMFENARAEVEKIEARKKGPSSNERF